MKERWKTLSAPMRYGLTSLVVGLGLILFWRLMSGFENLWASFLGAVNTVISVSLPFLGAVIISYALNPPVNWLEKGLLRMTRGKMKKPRILALTTVYLAVLGLVVWVLTDMMPDLITDMTAFIKWAPNYLTQLRNYYEDEILTQDFMQGRVMQELAAALDSLIGESTGSLSSLTASRLLGIVNGTLPALLNLGLALVLSFYLLTGNRRIFMGVGRFFFKRLGANRAHKLFTLTSKLDHVFGRYISAKVLESLILFVLCELVFWIIPVRYRTLMSLIIAVTNVVPYLGPVTGSVIVSLLALLDSPQLALWTAGAVVVIHLTDNRFIAPRVIGSFQGLHPFWVLAAVLIGGQICGIPGMILAVPVGAVVKILLTLPKDTFRNKKSELKKEETQP